jgi:hypothetical protein
MNKAYLLSLPVLALVAVAGVAAAFPMANIEDMTQEEKTLRVQMLELRQEGIGDQIAYLNGEITEEQFQERLQEHMDEMEPLREQMREMYANTDGTACGCGMGHGRFGSRMMRGW